VITDTSSILCNVVEPDNKHHDLLPFPLFGGRAFLILVDSTYYPDHDLKTLLVLLSENFACESWNLA
jgi:hypothetical protein